jgi:hypothetical protein
MDKIAFKAILYELPFMPIPIIAEYNPPTIPTVVKAPLRKQK